MLTSFASRSLSSDLALLDINLHADLHKHLNDGSHKLFRIELLLDQLLSLRSKQWTRNLNRQLLQGRLEPCFRVFTAFQKVVDQINLKEGDLLW